MRVTAQNVEKFLGPPKIFRDQLTKKDQVGVATGVAWTAAGGEILFVEATRMQGKGNLMLTGSLGEVMKESAQAALSYARAHASEFGIEPRIFMENDFHIHIPEGAIPKDGPSAGITMATALTSAFTAREVNCNVGMTGEITLRGRVLPVGGVREKVLAAHRAGIRTVMLPKRNMKDLIDLPKRAKEEMNIVPVEHMDQVLEVALVSQAKKIRPPRPRRKETRALAAEAGSQPAADAAASHPAA